MTHDAQTRLIDDLDALLDRERAALLTGDLEAIAAILHDKEKLIDRLNTLAPASRSAVSTLKEKVMRNQELLDGALEGIRAVAGRMAAVRKARRSLETYDNRGQKYEIPGVIDHQIEKRA
ncbi:flagellar protein FlgN [Pelagivirga sediminicola]|uniref:Flagellar protein FlgN n=1 Tax=Pelagivirga sediminicola TaxID=2170575 RepID=A0A2T7G5R2_9RHOB|nr:flagellar export chaperone FlgN [Pelagivirga sediminicola]PVA09707.1 flagellar protein FlgN [Pelagivirga sediminicola]